MLSMKEVTELTISYDFAIETEIDEEGCVCVTARNLRNDKNLGAYSGVNIKDALQNLINHIQED